jgi:hypothetical protein
VLYQPEIRKAIPSGAPTTYAPQRRVYVAASWVMAGRLVPLRDALRAAGFAVKPPEFDSDPEAEMAALAADALVALAPVGGPAGIRLGWMIAMGKPCFIMDEAGTQMADPLFDDQVRICRSVPELIEALAEVAS